jgi:hypothetical protein
MAMLFAPAESSQRNFAEILGKINARIANRGRQRVFKPQDQEYR